MSSAVDATHRRMATANTSVPTTSLGMKIHRVSLAPQDAYMLSFDTPTKSKTSVGVNGEEQRVGRDEGETKGIEQAVTSTRM